MPWEHCGRSVLDDQRCPACGFSKRGWTMRLNQTRALVITRPSNVDEGPQVAVLQEAAQDGAPFCEECAKAEAAEAARQEEPKPAPAAQEQQAEALQEAADDGAPFCEECAKAEAEEAAAAEQGGQA